MLPKTERKTDRRIERTRILLRDALMRLILKTGDNQKRYDEITVQDITDEANVARTTFYLHFKDKDELLFETMRDIYQELYENSTLPTMEAFVSDREEDCNAEEFEHVAEYPDFYRIMLSARGSAAFVTQVHDYLAEEIHGDFLPQLLPAGKEPRIPLDLMAHIVTGAEIAAIKWWLNQDKRLTTQQIAYLADSLIKRGLIWALRLDE